MQSGDMGEVRMETETETEPVRPKVTDSRGVLKQNRDFLDYFWDIAKPERETRLRAVEGLIEHVRHSQESDVLKYTLKRLVDGLCHAREEARSGYSLALAQVLSVFEEITLRSILDQIREKHNLQAASKKQIKHAVFGNFFGVLALSQSTRLHKEADVLLECVKLLQSLSQYREHLRDLPTKTIGDILNEVSEQMFEQVLFSALQEDLRSALSSPEQLELLLVVMRRFSSTLSSVQLNKLLGTKSIINTHTLPRLVEVVNAAARSVKKECVLPAVASDLLHMSLREDSFTFFWDSVVIGGLISAPPGPSHYLAFRLMGVALPLLSVSQLQYVLSGEVMKRYGEHVMTAQLPERFKFSPEMDECVCVFLRSCSDVEKQLLVLQMFTRLAQRGAPVVPSFWKVLEHAELAALKSYTRWLREQFCQPRVSELLEFTTRKQRRGQDSAHDPAPQTEECVSRLRKWIIPRLACIVENHQIKKDEELVMEITRFIFFHAFFDTVKSTSLIPESQHKVSPALDQNTRNITSSTFFSVLHSLSVLPVLGESEQSEAASRRSVLGVMADGSMWVHGLVQFADMLLKHTKHVRSVHTLSTEHTQAWDSMLQSVESLSKKMKKSPAPEHSAFQHLFLIIGIQMFKAPDDSVELLNDLRSCMEQAQAKKPKKKKTQKRSEADDEGAEPHWVEVVVDILLSLLAQPSRLIRSVCKTAFSRVCPYITQPALTAILNVLDPSKDAEESGMMVSDDKDTEKKKKTEEGEDEEEEEEQEAEDEEESDSSGNDEDDDDEEMEEDEEEVDQNFRLELMKVLQGQNALAIEDDGSSEDEELDDEAMMKLDENLAALFGEQKKKLQAKKDEKERLRKEKTLVRDFKIKVLDLLDVFLCKQGSSVLVLGLVEPLLSLIENCMSAESNQHEQDFLRRAAHIFRNQLCRGKHYCREVEGREAELHEMLERLIGRAQKLSDSSVALYYFSAALYLVKVLRGVMKDTDATHTAEKRLMGKVEVDRVTSCFRDALSSFMTRRKSPLTGDMFTELFNRFPVLCVNLVDTAVENITGGVREHQQGQACVLVLRALQSKEVKQLMGDAQWSEVCEKTTEKLTQTLQKVECKNKAVHEKMVKTLELTHFLIKTVHHQKLEVKLEDLRNVLRSMNADGSLEKSGKLEDTYWSVMKLFGLQKPKVEKMKKAKEAEQEGEEPKKKKKGFLPESKKRKNRKKPVILEGKEATDTPTPGGGGGGEGKKKRKNNKKKRSESESQSQSQPPAKKPKAQQPQSHEDKKQKKKKKRSSAE